MIILSASDAIIRDINILDAVFEIDNFYQQQGLECHNLAWRYEQYEIRYQLKPQHGNLINQMNRTLEKSFLQQKSNMSLKAGYFTVREEVPDLQWTLQQRLLHQAERQEVSHALRRQVPPGQHREGRERGEERDGEVRG